MTTDFSQFKRHGLLRVKQIVGKDGLIPISYSGWWAGVKIGKFPQPIAGNPLGSKITVWSAEAIFNYIDLVSKNGADNV